jgi:hypothetical protein
MLRMQIPPSQPDICQGCERQHDYGTFFIWLDSSEGLDRTHLVVGVCARVVEGLCPSGTERVLPNAVRARANAQLKGDLNAVLVPIFAVYPPEEWLPRGRKW